jgi:hypothetical protein
MVRLPPWEAKCFLTSNIGNLNEIWKEEIQDAIPRAVSFVDKGNNIMIYGLETGAA